jgi:hypothetical protein
MSHLLPSAANRKTEVEFSGLPTDQLTYTIQIDVLRTHCCPPALQARVRELENLSADRWKNTDTCSMSSCRWRTMFWRRENAEILRIVQTVAGRLKRKVNQVDVLQQHLTQVHEDAKLKLKRAAA